MPQVRPILFKAPMIRALLDGRKTQTRRIASRQDIVLRNGQPFVPTGVNAELPFKPNRAKGDVLWVKEPHALIWKEEGPPEDARDVNIEYRADTDAAYPGHWPAEEARGNPDAPKWRSALHMPTWASRLTLVLNDVRVERLQDISEADAIAEGIAQLPNGQWHWANHNRRDFKQHGYHTPVGAYDALWCEINGRESWPSNPWVMVMAFSVHKQNISDVLKKLSETA